MRLWMLVFACLIATGCGSQPARDVAGDAVADEHLSVMTVKTEEPFGVAITDDLGTAKALEAATAKYVANTDNSVTAQEAVGKAVDEAVFNKRVHHLTTDADVAPLAGHPCDYMKVKVLTGDDKGEQGWLLPSAHFR
jgi:hypothetical protein